MASGARSSHAAQGFGLTFSGWVGLGDLQYKWRVDEGDWTMVEFAGTSSTLDFSNDYDAGAHCLEVRTGPREQAR